MTLTRNQYVVFENGKKEGYLEARWSERHNAFYTFVENEEGETIKLFSNDVREKATRKSKKFNPSADTCTVEINPCGETEKAYAIFDGDNGKVGRGNHKTYYKYIAKSICYVDDNGRIYAPVWA